MWQSLQRHRRRFSCHMRLKCNILAIIIEALCVDQTNHLPSLLSHIEAWCCGDTFPFQALVRIKGKMDYTKFRPILEEGKLLYVLQWTVQCPKLIETNSKTHCRKRWGFNTYIYFFASKYSYFLLSKWYKDTVSILHIQITIFIYCISLFE